MKHHRWKDGGRGGGGRGVPMRSSDMFVVTMVKSALDELSRYSVEVTSVWFVASARFLHHRLLV